MRKDSNCVKIDLGIWQIYTFSAHLHKKECFFLVSRLSVSMSVCAALLPLNSWADFVRSQNLGVYVHSPGPGKFEKSTSKNKSTSNASQKHKCDMPQSD
jgi:hypothetical protein